jgi:Antitoxin SocA-like, Panacea domain
MSNAQPDERKLAELILYISQKCASDPTFGAVKLNKILYFSDFFAFGNWGSPITGVEYQHLPNGPAPRRLLPVRDQMVDNRDLVIQRVQLQSGNVQHRTVNLREPNLDLFSGREIALIDNVIEALDKLNAQQTSDLSHRMVGWKATSDSETIRYETIFLSDQPLSDAEVRRAQELAKEFQMNSAALNIPANLLVHSEP